ncbi:methyltransferase domain-containing protein [Guyparkeria hydrothermalis]|uniref:class I SAM-dependent methyltransferase n=1 Tax=Guyparkeria hydrothermalis TaxID=923 RepID=UPI0020218B3F|nr:class I SAM-dependent methyltransferase [Guyparkeria hydrothermalis]MCL7744287.1 methyltransferase domain-containing protein [Guyparkeria hydrothermalis]
MTIKAYNQKASTFFAQYQSVSFERVHGDWSPLLPDQAGLALDVGAASGRDALALAERGWDVIAVEPAAELRRLGEQETGKASVQWLDDQLPDLAQVRKLTYRFDLILVSAVWMHVAPTQRERAFRILTELLAPSGMLVITLRHGPGDGERVFHEVSKAELDALARHRAVMPVPLSSAPHADQLQRPEVWWETAVYRLPDDGTGALPTLRHVIVNDNKSSTYKLGLLRTLVRIADSAPGLVLEHTDEYVELPLGALGLFWVMLYHPLVLRHGLRQSPGKRGLGFATNHFNALKTLSVLDLRPGQSLSADIAPTVLHAIRDASANILKNPARFTTWPGTNRPIFDGGPKRLVIKPQAVRLDRETLARFGRFRVPASLWDTFSRYACWVEPAIVNEWVNLMQDWDISHSADECRHALSWSEGRRDTSLTRRMIESQLKSGKVECVWTGSDLRRKRHDIDHCFPWSRWSNNDLWNLMPSSATANAKKAEKLPADSLLKESRGRILDWWDAAIIGTEREDQFYAEAESSLPLLNRGASIESVFEAMLRQRLRLKTNLQLAEWMGL